MPARYGNMANGEMPDQIYGVTWNGKQALNYTYDSLGRLSNKSLPLYGDDPYNETFDTTYTYYDVNDTKTTTLLKSLSTMGVTHTYEYDELGNITSIYDGLEYNTYEYDYLGQLVRENLGYEDKTYTYEYVNGNIKRKHEYAYTTGTLPSTPLRTTNYYYENSMWPDMLTKITETRYAGSSSSAYSLNNVSSTNTLAQTLFGNNYNVVDLTENAVVTVGGGVLDAPSTNLTYATSSTKTLYTIGSDAIGNITNIGNVTVDWNGRRLESISQAGTELVSYEYNMDGQRTKKIVTDPTTGTTTTTEYFYNGSILAGQRKGNDEIVFMYDNNGDVFGFEYNGTPYYYVKNAQNDVYLIIDENGSPVVFYMYDSWGKVTGCLDATDFGLARKNPIMYRSYYVDLEMGMFIYYLNSRYYIADWGRFLNCDDTNILLATQGETHNANLFAYCNNNPVNKVDYNGREGVPLSILLPTVITAFCGVIAAPRSARIMTLDLLMLNYSHIEKYDIFMTSSTWYKHKWYYYEYYDIITYGGPASGWKKLIKDVEYYLNIYDTLGKVESILGYLSTIFGDELVEYIPIALTTILPVAGKIAAVLGLTTLLVVQIIIFVKDKIKSNLVDGSWYIFNWRVTLREKYLFNQEQTINLHLYSPIAAYI